MGSNGTTADGHLDHDAVVIGAGPAGLAAAKALRTRGLSYRHFEKGSMVGGLWRIDNDNGAAAAYHSLHLNSSRQRTQFPSHPMPDDWPDYPSHELVARYFQGFADDHGLTERITFRTAVTEVAPLDAEVVGAGAGSGEATQPGRRLPGAHGWRVTTDTGEQVTAAAVVIANGHHALPREPELAGTFTGTRFHSHTYTDPAVFTGQRVLVVGVGNSGMDIACDAAPLAAHVLLSTRHGVHVLPKYAFGRPIDHLSLPASAYLPFPVERRLYEAITRLAVGRPEDRGLPRPDHRLLEAHPTVSSQLYDLVGHDDIEVVGDIARLEDDHVRFTDQTVGANIALMEHQSEWIGDLLTGRCVLPAREAMHDWIARDRAAMAARYQRSARHTLQVDYWRYIRAIGAERARRVHALPRAIARGLQPVRTLQGRSA